MTKKKLSEIFGGKLKILQGNRRTKSRFFNVKFLGFPPKKAEMTSLLRTQFPTEK